MELTSKYRLEQIGRKWWLVAVGIVVGALAALLFSFHAGTTYVGKSTLLLSGRTPEQDAVMVVGYLTIFNDPATIERLKNANAVPEDVVVEATTAGASPILTIQAAAADPEVAQDAAETMAQAFSADINQTPRAGRDRLLGELQEQLATVAPLAPDGSANPYYTALLTQIDEVRSDSTNELLSLQPRAGLSEVSPKTAMNVVAGALGGLALGVLAALGLAVSSGRLATLSDIRNRTGVRPLVEVPVPSSDGARNAVREQRLLALTDVVDLECSPTVGVVVVTDARGGRQARDVAAALAELSAKRGVRTILVHADHQPGADAAADGIGFTDAVADGASIDHLLDSGEPGAVTVIPAGSVVGNRSLVISPGRVANVYDRLRMAADAIFIAAPPMSGTTETPVLAASADAVILVATRQQTRVGDVTTAGAMLAGTRAPLLGAVLVDTSPNGRRTVPFSGRRTLRDEDYPFIERLDPPRSYAGAQRGDSALN